MPKSYIALMVLAALLLLGGCNKPSASNGSYSPPKPIPVTIAIVKKAPLSTNTTIIGTLSAAREIQVFNQEEGQIIELPFYEGDRISKGTGLVRLDDAVVRAELLKANAQRRQAALDLTRMEKLLARNASSEDEVARARTAVELARAEEQLHRIKLARTTIKAPFSGIVSERLKAPGDIVPPHTHILTLIDPSSLNIEIYVSELLLPDLKVGDTAEIHIDALRDQRLLGRVSRVHPTIDPDNRQGIVEVALQPVPEGALPGQLARVTFSNQKAIGLMIPFASLRHDSQGPHVYRAQDDSIAKRVGVRTGIHLGDKIEILDGLAEGDEVIVSGLLNMRDGKSIRIVNKTPSTPQKTGISSPS